MKCSPVEIRTFSIRELVSGQNLALEKLSALRRNPFARSDATIAKIAGFCEGEEAGSEYVFPLLIKFGDAEFEALAGSSLCVDSRFRRSGLGMDIPELGWQHSPSRIGMGAALSQMALPVHHLLDYSVFLLPRNVMLVKSRAIIENKLNGVVASSVKSVVDFCIAAYALLLRATAAFALAGIRIDEVAADDDDALGEVADLTKDDAALFSEVHDVRWLKWHMTESFSKDGPLRLFVARKKGDIVGFYMTKRRFHEQASHRGFKNVWLGSVVEWQTRPEFCGKLGWLLVDGALHLRKDGVDAVEVSTADRALNGFFRRLGWRQVGESNFVVKAGEGSPLFGNEDMSKIENWRLRPAMGDAGLS